MNNNDLNALTREINDNLISDLNSQFDNVITEGLKRKGFKFKLKKDLIEFIRLNCTTTEHGSSKQKLYLVNREPFMVHLYSTKIEFHTPTDKEPFKVSACLGTYKFL